RRPLSNQQAIADRLKLLDFVPIDFADMEMQEQVRWACETRYLVAVHGAGIANYLFHRVGQLSFLELTPPSKQSDWVYREMAQAMVWDYQVLSGAGNDSEDTFEVDPDLVASTTEALVRSSSRQVPSFWHMP